MLDNHIHQTLISYQKASAKERKRLLEHTEYTLVNLPGAEEVHTKHEACEIYQTLAEAATLLKYAEILYAIENQQYFHILADWHMPDIFSDPAFTELNHYFELHPERPKMRLKQSISDTPEKAWLLFGKAQEEKMMRCGKADKFKFQEEVVTQPGKDRLYPLPIMGFWNYPDHYAVDQIYIHKDGRFCVVQHHDEYLLPGGGMLDTTTKPPQEVRLARLITQHLQESEADLRSETLYQEIYHFAERHTTWQKMEVLCDERVGGGRQFSYVGEMDASLSEFIASKLQSSKASQKTGDDTVNSKPIFMTYLELLQHFSSTNASPILIVKNRLKTALENNHLDFKSIWQIDGYEKTRHILLSACESRIETEIKADYLLAKKSLLQTSKKKHFHEKIKKLVDILDSSISKQKSSQHDMTYFTAALIATEQLVKKEIPLPDYEKIIHELEGPLIAGARLFSDLLLAVSLITYANSDGENKISLFTSVVSFFAKKMAKKPYTEAMKDITVSIKYK